MHHPANAPVFRLLRLTRPLLSLDSPVTGELLAECGNLGHALVRWSTLTARAFAAGLRVHYVIADAENKPVYASLAVFGQLGETPVPPSRGFTPQPSLN